MEVRARERKLGAGVVEVRRGLPRVCVVARRAVLPAKLSAMGAVRPVTRRALRLYIRKLNRTAGLSVARCAGDRGVLANERKTGRGVVEVADLLPAARVVTRSTIADGRACSGRRSRNATVRVFAAMARRAVGSDAEVRFVECPGGEFEAAHVGGGDELGLVTAPTVCARMLAEKRVARLPMVEGVRIEPDHVEVSPKVLFMARRAIPFYSRVKSFVATDARLQRRVTVEAFRRFDPTLPEVVAGRTVRDPLVPGVRLRQLARRDQLRADGKCDEASRQQQKEQTSMRKAVSE